MAVDNRIYWIWLAQLLGQGSKLASRLINEYGSAQTVYETPAAALLEKNEFSETERSVIKKSLADKSLEQAQYIMEECARLKINIAIPDSPEYPKSLRALTDMPLVLYYRGKIPDSRERLFIAVVGTRKMSDYGRKIAYSLGYGMALGGAIIVSGMALGSDSMAMAGAMDAGAPAIAVLGSGVDVIYPREHRDMYYKTIENGAVISEYPPGSAPAGHHFPVRNRIISGLAEGTVVVEGSATSGSLITARHAAEQGKKVFAVPGKVGDPGSEGPLNLLHDNALPVSTAEDVLAEFKFLYPHTINVDYVHAKLRNMNFEDSSQTAMEKARIGTRGESPYYGTGVHGGRARDYRKNTAKAENRAAESTENPKKEEQSVPSLKPKPSLIEKVKKPVLESMLGRKTQKAAENTEKKNTKSEENKNITTGFALNMLDENDIKVYNNMQPNVPVIPDTLVREDLEIGDIMSALSTLELAGLVESAVGGYFIRTGDNMPITLADELTNTPDANHE